MVDRDTIIDYRPPTPQIEAVDGDRLRIYCGDDVPAIGTAVAIAAPPESADRRLYAVTERHTGTERIDAWLPMCPDWIGAGLSISTTDTPAGIAPPDDDILTPGPTLIRPMSPGDLSLRPTRPEWTDLSSERPPISTGIDAVDQLAPLCAGGINLIIDASDQSEASLQLARRVDDAISPQRRCVAGPTSHLQAPWPDANDTPSETLRIAAGSSLRSQLACLQLVISYAPRLRRASSALALVNLPELQSPSPDAGPAHATRPPQGLAHIIERLGRHLVSTDQTCLTTLLVLRLPPAATGLADIIETLNLGDVDTVIHIDADGRFDPRRSTSRADLSDDHRRTQTHHRQVLDQAQKASDKATLLGEGELDADERESLTHADALHPQI